MLRNIEIKNFILIDDANIIFGENFNVITGESGTGKSIIFDALELVLGGRNVANVAKNKEENTTITATFDISKYSSVILSLKEKEQYRGDILTFSRIIGKDRKSKSFINGEPAPLTEIKEIGEQILHIYGQSSHQNLLSVEYQAYLFDKYCGLEGKISELDAVVKDFQNLSLEIRELEGLLADKSKIPYLEHQMNELENYNLERQHLIDCKSEHEGMQNSVANVSHIGSSLACFSSDDFEVPAVIDLLKKGEGELKKVKFTGEPLESLQADFITLYDQIEIMEDKLRDMLSLCEFDEERYAELDEMINKLEDIARKHNVDMEDLQDFYNRTKLLLENLQNGEENILILKERLIKVKAKYHLLADEITMIRTQNLAGFISEINENIAKLNMKGLNFSVVCTAREQVSRFGNEMVEFYLNNIGFDPAPLKKSASGGELSRISLVLQTILASKRSLPTILFDEVDVGISGNALLAVADFFTKMKKTTQLIAITHQGQVAARSDKHFLIEKVLINDKSSVKITTLDDAGKLKALADLIGGENALIQASMLLK